MASARSTFMATFISHSPMDTAALGEAWGKNAQAGWVVGLSGELGAGKTELVKGLAKGLGITVPVHSPTYALLHEYSGPRLTLFHLDFYRLETAEQIERAGLTDYFHPQGVAVIEWIDRWKGAPPPHFTRAHIEIVDEAVRRIVYEDSGP